ncbi:hypothetical protein MHBO_000532 [Bonamia ostreae]|uniref:Ubiquitin carboxyl-terminal hydrolase n=1 Tax=Bonamia ostreae TaxID=126728 RepID=A0ABV2AFZ1_9EUKA
MWSTIESDPGVFTELIERLGVKNISVEEYYDLDTLDKQEKVFGLIFLFKWTSLKPPNKKTKQQIPQNLFFARQIIDNACATQAILSVLLNSSEIQLGKFLNEFKKSCSSCSHEEKGIVIGNSKYIKSVHNSFNTHGLFYSNNGSQPSQTEDAFHFITLVPFENAVYELDGLKFSPVLIGFYLFNFDILQLTIFKRFLDLLFVSFSYIRVGFLYLNTLILVS